MLEPFALGFTVKVFKTEKLKEYIDIASTEANLTTRVGEETNKEVTTNRFKETVRKPSVFLIDEI